VDDPEIRRFQAEARALLDEGLKRLDFIEKDIKELQQDCLSRNPAAVVVAAALNHADAAAQFETIKQSRSALSRARDKIIASRDTFSDADADELCNILDGIKELGQKLAQSSQRYRAYLQAVTENN